MRAHALHVLVLCLLWTSMLYSESVVLLCVGMVHCLTLFVVVDRHCMLLLA